jgi:ubiquinone/menaquinone biosynthesis C-methylase UbiE
VVEEISSIRFAQYDALSLNYPDNTFDVFHARHVLHYLNALAALKQMQRVPKPRGKIIVRDSTRTLRWPVRKKLEELDEITNSILKEREGIARLAPCFAD